MGERERVCARAREKGKRNEGREVGRNREEEGKEGRDRDRRKREKCRGRWREREREKRCNCLVRHNNTILTLGQRDVHTSRTQSDDAQS